jgi:hypothetical protein
MKKFLTPAALFALTLVVTYGVAQEGRQALQSGPQVGKQVPGPFHPVNVTGKFAGEKHCLYCDNGNCPVAMIFAREVSPGLTNLVKKIDTATAQNRKAYMGSFVVFLSDREGLADQLKSLASKENIKKTVLSIDNPAGPQAYKVSQDADVTVVLYENHTVRSNYAFRKGELNDQAIGRILADLPKILNPAQ